jgi:mono/diheme cytochrome c family protein
MFVALSLVSAGCADSEGVEPGVELSSAEIGDSSKGAQLFESKHCSECHGYDGEGGDDAAPLDYMKGQLSATDVANMAGTIWNHMPQMIPHFADEGIAMPTFAGNEMADLVAYLHGGPPGEDGSAPSGHVGGEDLSAAVIGDAAVGESIFDDKRCSECHNYDGHGGDDAPALDFMAGHLSATEIANMSGTLWNDMPVMLTHFEDEGVAVPTFSGDEMADLVAYLHGGPID